jgi:hypothetical protein
MCNFFLKICHLSKPYSYQDKSLFPVLLCPLLVALIFSDIIELKNVMRTICICCIPQIPTQAHELEDHDNQVNVKECCIEEFHIVYLWNLLQ